MERFRITISLPGDLYERLRLASSTLRTSMSSLVRDAVASYLEQLGFNGQSPVPGDGRRGRRSSWAGRRVVSFKADPSFVAALEREAERRGLTLSEYIRRTLAESLMDNGRVIATRKIKIYL